MEKPDAVMRVERRRHTRLNTINIEETGRSENVARRWYHVTPKVGASKCQARSDRDMTGVGRKWGAMQINWGWEWEGKAFQDFKIEQS